MPIVVSPKYFMYKLTTFFFHPSKKEHAGDNLSSLYLNKLDQELVIKKITIFNTC